MSQSLDRRQGLSDIWPLVFQYLLDPFESGDIANLTLTCSEFRWIAQPLVFQRLRVNAFKSMRDRLSTEDHVLAVESESFTIEDMADEVHRQLERFRFWAIPRFASSVKTCHITTALFTDSPNIQKKIDTVIDAAIATLPAFANLQKLMLAHIDLTRERLLELAKMKLRVLEVYECNTPAGLDLLLRVNDLRIVARPSEITGVQALTRMIQLDALTSFDIARLIPYTVSVLSAFPVMHSMQLLHRLDISIASDSPHQSQLLSFVSKLPLLRHLAVWLHSCPNVMRFEHPIFSQTTTLASLWSYHGPMSILGHLRLPQLRHLCINGSDLATRCPYDPASLINTFALAHFQDMIRNLSYLEISIYYLTVPLAKTLFSLLPSQSSIATFKLFVHSFARRMPVHGDILMV
jgi:hypothetical protein